MDDNLNEISGEQENETVETGTVAQFNINDAYIQAPMGESHDRHIVHAHEMYSFMQGHQAQRELRQVSGGTMESHEDDDVSSLYSYETYDSEEHSTSTTDSDDSESEYVLEDEVSEEGYIHVHHQMENVD